MDIEKKLKNRRLTVRGILDRYFDKNKDGSKYAAEYEELTERLNAMGHKYTLTKDYYYVKYWRDKKAEPAATTTIPHAVTPIPHPTTDTLNVINIVCTTDQQVNDIIEFACGLGLSKYKTSKKNTIYKLKAYKSSDEMSKIKDIIKLFIKVTRSEEDREGVEIF